MKIAARPISAITTCRAVGASRIEQPIETQLAPLGPRGRDDRAEITENLHIQASGLRPQASGPDFLSQIDDDSPTNAADHSFNSECADCCCLVTRIAVCDRFVGDRVELLVRP